MGKNSNGGKIKWIIGIDEAGRGPLAGPITIGAVVIGPLNPKHEIRNPKLLKGIKDSKKLTPKKREEWHNKISSPHQILVGGQESFTPPARGGAGKLKIFFTTTASVGNQIIDRVGIQKATHLAVARALRKIAGRIGSPTPLRKSDFLVMLDGLLKAPEAYEQKTIIRGDESVPLISAASIIAKVSRDRKMLRYHKKYPAYGFDKHKGYATKLHYQILRKHGPSKIHRKSFRLK